MYIHTPSQRHIQTSIHTYVLVYASAGLCLYGTFSGLRAAVGTINDNLSLATSSSDSFVDTVSLLSLSLDVLYVTRERERDV